MDHFIIVIIIAEVDGLDQADKLDWFSVPRGRECRRDRSLENWNRRHLPVFLLAFHIPQVFNGFFFLVVSVRK